METAYDTESTIPLVHNRFWRKKTENIEAQNKVISFVMSQQTAEDYKICEKNSLIEIRDGFNSNLVIQRYGSKKKVVIYIPQDWEKTITIEINGGTVMCHQKEIYRGLEIKVNRGNIFYSFEDNV